MDELNDFLSLFGSNPPQENSSPPQAGDWEKVIRPASAYLILGRRGSGKSALGGFLLETFSKRYNLLPCWVGLPQEKTHLLPPRFVAPPISELPDQAIILIDEGAMNVPARRAMSSANLFLLKMLSLVRQKNQIVLIIFHYARLVDVGILAYLDGVLIKEPGLWDIAYGGKGELVGKLLMKAGEAFDRLKDEERKRFTFVSSPQARFEGLIENPLPSFWSDELSKAWAGIATNQTIPQTPMESFFPRKSPTGWRADDQEMKVIYPVTPEMERRGKIIEITNFSKSAYAVLEDEETKIRWIKRLH